ASASVFPETTAQANRSQRSIEVSRWPPVVGVVGCSSVSVPVSVIVPTLLLAERPRPQPILGGEVAARTEVVVWHAAPDAGAHTRDGRARTAPAAQLLPIDPATPTTAPPANKRADPYTL